MKKMFTYTLMLLLAAVAFTSCEPDPDRDLAYDIEGVWEGAINGDYYARRYSSNYNDYTTEIEFVRVDAYGGYGYEVDYRSRYSSGSPIGFDWTVKNGNIYLEYDDGYNIIITDYKVRMRDRLVFTGYFEDWDTGEQLAAFRLYKIAEPTYDYDYGTRYSRSTKPGSDAKE